MDRKPTFRLRRPLLALTLGLALLCLVAPATGSARKLEFEPTRISAKHLHFRLADIAPKRVRGARAELRGGDRKEVRRIKVRRVRRALRRERPLAVARRLSARWKGRRRRARDGTLRVIARGRRSQDATLVRHPSSAPPACPLFGWRPPHWPGACWRPFASGSAFNAPIPANPPLLTDSDGDTSDEIVAQMRSHAGGRTDMITINTGGSWDYSHPFYFADGSDPLATVELATGWDQGHVDGRRIRVPRMARPAYASGDGHLTVIQPEDDPAISPDVRGHSVGLYGTQARPPGGWVDGGTIEATSGGRSHLATGSGTDLGNSTAAGFNNLAGIMRAQELLEGRIDHALFALVNCTTGTSVAPAQPGRTGTVCGSSRYSALPSSADMPPLGARLQLDPAYDISGFPPTQRAILQALQTYGALIGDTGAPGKRMMFGVLPESGEAYVSLGYPDELARVGERAVAEGWGHEGTNDGTGYYHLDFGKGVDWSRLRVVAPY